MGRIAGATAAKTREKLLAAAADAFAARGYDGTRVADIAAAAGVSNGALYAHFGSKAELLVAALRAHGQQQLEDVIAADPGRPVIEALVAAGRGLRRRREPRGYLIVEALVAARRDPAVATLMGDQMGERTGLLAGLVRAAQRCGQLDPGLSAEAIAHFCFLLAMGSALVTPDLHDVGEEDWAALLTQVAGSLITGHGTDRRTAVKVQIDPGLCQGHGRCYDLAPELFGDDEEGYGVVLGDGLVPAGQEQAAQNAAANCPERAVSVTGEA